MGQFQLTDIPAYSSMLPFAAALVALGAGKLAGVRWLFLVFAIAAPVAVAESGFLDEAVRLPAEFSAEHPFPLSLAGVLLVSIVFVGMAIAKLIDSFPPVRMLGYLTLAASAWLALAPDAAAVIPPGSKTHVLTGLALIGGVAFLVALGRFVRAGFSLALWGAAILVIAARLSPEERAGGIAASSVPRQLLPLADATLAPEPRGSTLRILSALPDVSPDFGVLLERELQDELDDREVSVRDVDARGMGVEELIVSIEERIRAERPNLIVMSGWVRDSIAGVSTRRAPSPILLDLRRSIPTNGLLKTISDATAGRGSGSPLSPRALYERIATAIERWERMGARVLVFHEPAGPELGSLAESYRAAFEDRIPDRNRVEIDVEGSAEFATALSLSPRGVRTLARELSRALVDPLEDLEDDAARARFSTDFTTSSGTAQDARLVARRSEPRIMRGRYCAGGPLAPESHADVRECR